MASLHGLNFAAGATTEALKLGCLHTPASIRTQLKTRWRSRFHVVRATEFKEGKVSAAEEGWEDDREQRRQRASAKRAAAARELEEKLNHTARRKRYVQEQLAKLDGQMKLAEAPPVKEQITDQERYMFMKLGLRMRARLLLGRRGVFDGTVENMHLHWKYRDLVKIIFKGPLFEAEQTAKILEVESGGVFVGITETTKGQAMIFYRGKSYERPSVLRPRNLLTKRQALERSLEMQRKNSLEQHILKLEKEMGKLQVGLKYTREGDNDLERLLLSEAMGTKLEDFDDDVAADNEEEVDVKYSRNPKSRSVPITLDPIFKAQPLTIQERIRLRQEALKKCDPLIINVGKSNMVSGLAKAIRLYFMKHPFAIVGVKGRAKGTPVEEIIQQIEEATGAVLVSREPNKLIIYRGWPAGEHRPDMVTEGVEEPLEEVPQELRAAILSEEVRDPLDFSYLTREECALVGIEYTGNGNEAKDDGDEIRWNHTEAGEGMWSQELVEEKEEEVEQEEGEYLEFDTTVEALIE